MFKYVYNIDGNGLEQVYRRVTKQSRPSWEQKSKAPLHHSRSTFSPTFPQLTLSNLTDLFWGRCNDGID